jgi:hypothetical protein
VMANEGDAREWGSYVEAVRLGSAGYVLDPTLFPDAVSLKANTALGRMNVCSQLGDVDNDGDFDRIYAFGARSFAIVRASDGMMVYDSGSEFESTLARRYPAAFNVSHTSNAADARSDDKGPEPEALALAKLGGSTFALIGLERQSGIMVYDVTLPEAPRFVSYATSRDTSVSFDPAVPAERALAGDLGPESIVFVPGEDSPTGEPLVLMGNEVSGTTAVFAVTPILDGDEG